MDFETVKALHIIFVVSWFAGLFYIVRLFIYHTEAQERDEVAKKILSDQYQIMEKKLWWIITTPAMVLTVLFGVWMLFHPFYQKFYFLNSGWMQIKLGFVAVLLFYHFKCQHMMKQLKKGIFNWKSNQLRLWNELATLVLVAVVFLVELQNNLDWIKGTLGFFGVAIGLMIGIKIYKKSRSKTSDTRS
jgi:putative membrane protein